MKKFGKYSSTIIIREMVCRTVKIAETIPFVNSGAIVNIPEAVRKFCRGEAIDFKKEHDLILDDIGRGLLTVCEDTEEMAATGMNVARTIETAKITLAEVLTDVVLREICKTTEVEGSVKHPFLHAFQNLLQYKYLGGEDSNC